MSESLRVRQSIIHAPVKNNFSEPFGFDSPVLVKQTLGRADAAPGPYEYRWIRLLMSRTAENLPTTSFRDLSGRNLSGAASRPVILLFLAVTALCFAGCDKPLDPAEVGFAAPVPYMTGGSGPISVQAADFNGDGRIDLAIINKTSGDVAILLGNGDGSFQTAVPYPPGVNDSSPIALAVADFNGDGKPDLVVVNSSAAGGSSSISILLNNGDGTFGAASNIATPASGQSIAVGDLNDDGLPDLWIGSSPQSFVMLGKGDGTFQVATMYATTPSGSGGAMGVAIGDVNNDGKPDLLASNFSQNTVGILLNTGNGQFSNLSTVATQGGPAAIALADLNQDSNLDMVVANLSFNTATVRYGAGDGTFTNHLFTSAGSRPASVALADFGGSGFLSAAFANSNGNGITIVAGAANGTFADTYNFVTSKNIAPKPSCAVAADFNGDGKPDIAVVNFNDNTVVILLNNFQ